MSHGVGRLWTGAIALLMGCQSLPSTMTKPFDAAPIQTTSHDEVTSFERPDTSPAALAATGDQLHASEAAEDASLQWSAHSIPPEPLEAGPPDHGSEFNAQSDDAFLFADTPDEMDRESSLPTNAAQVSQSFESFRHRLLRSESQEVSGEEIETGPEINQTAEFVSEGEDSSVVLVGHDESGQEVPFRKWERKLEAPVPYSASLRKSGSDDPEEPEARSAARTRTASTPADKRALSEGPVGSLFDVFGIGGERAGQSRKITGPLRQASTTSIERPLSDPPMEPSSVPPTDSLRESLQTVHWQEELDRLTALLETQLAHQSPGGSALEQEYYLRQHVALRLLYLIGSRRPEALQSIPDCDPSQQEFWTEILWALSNIFDDEVMPDQAERARETTTRLRAALTHIAPVAGLRLTHTLFCRQIDGFGSYLLFDRDEFTPGQSVLVYTEVQNFTSVPTSDGEFATKLQSTLRIHRENVTGPIVFEEHLPAAEDRCLSRRMDYFHSYRITLPSNLAPGPHVLTLTVRDENSQKLGSTSLSFVIR